MLTNNLLFGVSYQRSIYSTCFSVNHCSSFTQFGKQHFYFFCHSTADAPLCNFGANERYSSDSWLFRFLWFKEQISFFPTLFIIIFYMFIRFRWKFFCRVPICNQITTQCTWFDFFFVCPGFGCFTQGILIEVIDKIPRKRFEDILKKNEICKNWNFRCSVANWEKTVDFSTPSY